MTAPVVVVDGKKPCGNKGCLEANPQSVKNFNRSSQTVSGLRSYCRNCEKGMRDRPEAKQRDTVRAKERYKQDPESVRARSAAWYARNREAAINRISAHQAANRDRVNERFRLYRAEGRYRQLDRAHSAKRRAALASLPSEQIDLDRLYERDKGICRLCGIHVERSLRWPHPQSESLDHVWPVSRGGAHTWENVQLTHLRCNMKKGARV